VDQGPIDLGAVAVTDAYDLDAEWVIHAAAMPHYGDGQEHRRGDAERAGRRGRTGGVLARAPSAWLWPRRLRPGCGREDHQ